MSWLTSMKPPLLSDDDACAAHSLKQDPNFLPDDRCRFAVSGIFAPCAAKMTTHGPHGKCNLSVHTTPAYLLASYHLLYLLVEKFFWNMLWWHM